MQNQQRGLVPGSLVRARGERWRVRQARVEAEVASVALDGADDSNRHRHSVLLAPFDRIEPVTPPRAARVRRDALLRGVAGCLAAARPRHGLWSAASASMALLPWQLEPALAVVSGATRLLLADEVGLGKTVQAGLVLAELHARGLLERALVLTPASVRAQWVSELTERFALPAAGLDLATLLELERMGPAGANPWSRAAIIVSSIDLVKRPDVYAAIERLPLDAVVVDEAHHLSPGTERAAVVGRLACQVPWVILASATPHGGDGAAYRGLIETGAVRGDPGALQVFRRSHAARVSVRRRTRVRRVVPNPDEAALLAGVLAYARRLCEPAAGQAPGARLFASLLSRRAASSPWAAHATLRRRLAALVSGRVVPPAATAALPWEETDAEDDAEPWLPAAGLTDRPGEIAQVQALLAAAEQAGGDPSKARYVARLARRTREPLIVFSEFRDTVEAYASRLGACTTVAVLHGGVDAAERARRVKGFLAGGARVLLTTDVAGEGLNLQHGARTVITVEWPWSPLRLEQRIGRVHRLGQAHDVHAVHLTALGSYEDTVVARVLQRAANAAHDLAALAQVTEQEVEAAVLDDVRTPAVRREEPEPDADPAAIALGDRARLEASRASRLRRLSGLVRRPVPSPAWTWPARRCRPRHVIVVVEVVAVSAAGTPLESTLSAVTVNLTRSPARHEWGALCRALADDVRVRRAAVAAATRPHLDSWAGTRSRLAALIDARDTTRAGLRQSSLFDTRADRTAVEHGLVRDEWNRWQRRTLARLDPEPATVRSDVVAVIPMAERPA